VTPTTPTSPNDATMASITTDVVIFALCNDSTICKNQKKAAACIRRIS
jgi:hypothetical protein